jgi:hypothetical protein
MTTIEERREMIKEATNETLIEWFQIYTRNYNPLTNTDEDIKTNYEMVKEEVMRRLTK